MFDHLYIDHFKTLHERYDRALENHGVNKLIVYSGHVKKRFQDDLPYPFYTDVQFKALVPLIDAPDSWVIWKIGKAPLLLLYQPEDFWHAAPQLPETYWTPYFEINTIKEKGLASKYLGDTRKCAFLGEINEDIANWELGQHNPKELIAELNWHRSFKTLYEQASITQANHISAKGHLSAREAFYNGASELEISLAFQQACGQSEEKLSYPSIVGINEHASILHYWGSCDALSPKAHHSLLIDAAASCNGYAADITRTYAYKEGIFADMIIELDAVQQTLVKEHKVGVNYSELNLMMLNKVADLLRGFGVLKLDASLAVENDIISYFLPHPLGHFLGLQVHDVGNNQKDALGNMFDIDPKYPLCRMLRPIEPNHVVTVEPGVYFIDSLLNQLYNSKDKNTVCWDLVNKLKPYGGIRIEDNILITEDGPENLTRKVLHNV